MVSFAAMSENGSFWGESINNIPKDSMYKATLQSCSVYAGFVLYVVNGAGIQDKMVCMLFQRRCDQSKTGILYFKSFNTIILHTILWHFRQSLYLIATFENNFFVIPFQREI